MKSPAAIYLLDRLKIFAGTTAIGAVLGAVISWPVRAPWTVFIRLGLTGACLIWGYEWLYRPYKSYRKTLILFNTDFLYEELFEQKIMSSHEMQGVLHKLRHIIIDSDILTSSRKQAQYLALQNQINPHFLYNTLEAIRSEAISAGLESVDRIAEALSTYFRYTISNMENMVTLNDELENIRNYYLIQQFRFGDRISMTIDLNSPELGRYPMPKLLLQPIIENSIYHGIERKMGKGHLRISGCQTDRNVMITISDDGIGIDEVQLAALNEKLKAAPGCGSYDQEFKTEKREGIAVFNVNTRIKLIYGEEYGLQYYSIKGEGTDVVLTLPANRGDFSLLPGEK